MTTTINGGGSPSSPAVARRTASSVRIALTGIRQRHPGASERECSLRFSLLKLGSEATRRLYPDAAALLESSGPESIGRYDPATDQIDWTLGIGQDGTHMLVLDQDRDLMFLPNIGSNTVTMVEGAMAGPARATLTDIPVPGVRPEGLDLSPDGRELWTATRGDGGVSIIDVASRRVVETLDLGMQDANRLKFTPDGRVLIIDGEAASLVVMDAASRAVIERVTVGSTDTGDGAVLVAPDGSRAYLGLRAADRVAVVDLNTLEVIREMPMGDGAGPGCLYWIGAP